MEQLVAIVAVSRLAILKRVPVTPLTLSHITHIGYGNKCKMQVQSSGKMKTWGGSRT